MEVWVHLYGSNILDTQLPNGSTVKLTQQTNYPWDGDIQFAMELVPDQAFALRLRIPAWARDAKVQVNGRSIDHTPRAGDYFEIARRWQKGDKVELTLPMPVQLIEAHPLVEAARNQVAVRRGPIVYCLESPDLPAGLNVSEVALAPNSIFNSRFDSQRLGGIVTLSVKARRLPGGDWDGQLYRELSKEPSKPTEIELIPYYAWGNRGPSEMTVWMPIR